MKTCKQFNIKTPLNYSLVATEFLADKTESVVVILSATGVLQNYYYKLASFLQQHNYTVYTFDYSGIGKSKTVPLTKFDTTLSNWATNDIESVFKHIKKLHPTKKINCIGHSLGGQLLGLVPSNKLIHHTILVASQSNHYSFWKGFNKVKVYFNWFIIFPFFTSMFKYLPSKLFIKMENLPKSVAKEFSKWSKQKEYYFSKKILTEKYHHQITKKITAYSCTNDKFAPKKAVDWLTNTYTNAITTRKHLLPKDYKVQEIGHFGFFRKQFKDSIWKEFLQDLQN